MKRITSFCVDHTKIEPGMYISRIDGDIITYDIRFIKPNLPPFMNVSEIHTIEHIFATFVRNSKFESNIIYFGPMGCRTGFYFLTRSLPHSEAIDLTRDALSFIENFEAQIPGCSAAECGNFKDHDLNGAKIQAKKMRKILSVWDQNMLNYPQ